MRQISMVLPPPRLWQEFEELTKDAARYFFNDDTATAYGNQGAAQNGVDVYCRKDGNGHLIGIQCKRVGKLDAQGNRLPGGLKPENLKKEIGNAEKHLPKLDRFIIATTDSRSTSIQNEAKILNAQQLQNRSFTFEVWFWEDFLGFLHKYAPLLQWYYDRILQLKGVYNTNHQILYLFHMAFSRPAFNTRLTAEENGSDLLQALIDTETALDTGHLRDRVTTGLLRVAPGGIGMISDDAWKAELLEVLHHVQDARALYRKARDTDHTLIELADGTLKVTDGAISQALDDLRRQAVQILNGVLVGAGLPKVDSRL